MPFQFSGIHGACLVPLRFSVHDGAEPLKAGNPVFELLRKVDQGHDGADEHIYGYDERGIVAETDLPVIQKQAARNQHHHVENIGHKRVPAVETAHGAVGIPAGPLEPLIAFLKLFLFFVRVGKSLCHPDAADAAFQARVDIRHGGTRIPECLPHLFPQGIGNNHQERHAGKDNQRQPDIDGAEINERHNDAQHGNHQVFRAVVCQFHDVEQVVRHPAHDLPCLMGIIKTVGQPFQVLKHIAAHTGLHVYAHHMPLILNKVVQQHLCDVQA